MIFVNEWYLLVFSFWYWLWNEWLLLVYSYWYGWYYEMYDSCIVLIHTDVMINILMCMTIGFLININDIFDWLLVMCYIDEMYDATRLFDDDIEWLHYGNIR